MLLAFLLPAAPAFAVQPTIAPGYWETRTDWLGQKGAPDRLCIKPQDVARFLSGPSNHIYRCTYPVSIAAGGAISFEGTCADKKGQKIKLRGKGAYTAAAVHMTATGTAKTLGIPLSGGASVDAHLISATCPAGAKAFS
jgi:Protein of unknown function (DUF3617)